MGKKKKIGHWQSSCKLYRKHQIWNQVLCQWQKVPVRRLFHNTVYSWLYLQLKLPATVELERESPLANKFPQNTPTTYKTPGAVVMSYPLLRSPHLLAVTPFIFLGQNFWGGYLAGEKGRPGRTRWRRFSTSASARRSRSQLLSSRTPYS